ncbi:hypothetical protein [Rhodoferax mekongensis]|uniref:Uncharacterized protein n=1 Tax=Rhodoferax mekongensis TaxID=3068341 RepID=A0ABZ0B2E2_9BURK|nr:hypothetical protein [Rhodoferax sp. TBRC 17307]WNO06023.1 hypothetical protein RAN89_06225 [Rhodoferax sp. TBRC 17307]
MKIKPEHLDTLRQHIAALDTPERREQYRKGDFPRAEAVKDLNKRYRWDLFNAAVPAKWVCDVLYKYSHDEHIDTALRNIVKPLEV